MSKKDLHEVEDPKATYYSPKPEGERRFWKKHIVAKHLYPVDPKNNDTFGAVNMKKDTTIDQDLPRPEDRAFYEEKKARVVNSFREKVANKKKVVKEQALIEADGSAPSDSPSAGDTSQTSGKVDHVDKLDKDNDDKNNKAKDMLESIALQAAEMHDMLTKETKLETWAQDKLSLAKDNLDELFEYLGDKANMNNESYELGEDTTDSFLENRLAVSQPKFNNDVWRCKKCGTWVDSTVFKQHMAKEHGHYKAEELDPEEEQLVEVINKGTKSSKIIDDFVHSKNPKFAGKTKAERIRMGLGAYYSLHKEEVENLDELSQEYVKSYMGKSVNSARDMMGKHDMFDPNSHRDQKVKHREHGFNIGMKLLHKKIIDKKADPLDV